MGETSKDNGALLALNDLPLKLQTIVPSCIRTCSIDGVSGSVASTLKGSQNKRLFSVVDLESLPDGWTRIKHPDSGVYYVNKEKSLCTSSDVLNSRTCSLIMQSAKILQASPALRALLEDQEVGLVLDVQHTKGSVRTLYYCVSHVERCIFWLEGIGHEEVYISCPSNKCIQSEGSRVHCIEAQYWKHCELFPTTFTVTKDVTRELKDILLQTAADRLLVKFSTSPYDKDALEYMLNVVKEIEAVYTDRLLVKFSTSPYDKDALEYMSNVVKETEDVREGSGHTAWIIARFMALYNDGVLRSSYGQTDDYFDIEDIKPKIGPYRRPILLTVLAPLFLRSPDLFAVELHSFHESFTLARWSKFVHKVDQSIRDSNLLATVLLTTNVGLLAWSGGGKKDGINSPTAAQIVTYISIIFSVGSIIIGLAIFKQYRAKGADSTPLRAVVVVRRILKEPFGLERLAIIFSLPYVLLIWGLIAFLVAFGIIFYEDTPIQVRIPVTIVLLIVVLFLCFCMFTAGPPKREDSKPRKQSCQERVSSSKV